MSEENENVVVVTENTEDIKRKVQNIIFKTLKDNVNGHVYVNVEEKTDDVQVDSVFVNIGAFGIKYDYRMSLQGKTYEMVKESDDYAATLGLMILDNYKEFINKKFFEVNRKHYKHNKQNSQK